MNLNDNEEKKDESPDQTDTRADAAFAACIKVGMAVQKTDQDPQILAVERTASLIIASNTAVSANCSSNFAASLEAMDPTSRTEVAIREIILAAKLQEEISDTAQLLVEAIKSTVQAICTTEKTCEYARFIIAAVEAAVPSEEEMNKVMNNRNELEALRQNVKEARERDLAQVAVDKLVAKKNASKVEKQLADKDKEIHRLKLEIKKKNHFSWRKAKDAAQTAEAVAATVNHVASTADRNS